MMIFASKNVISEWTMGSGLDRNSCISHIYMYANFLCQAAKPLNRVQQFMLSHWLSFSPFFVCQLHNVPFNRKCNAMSDLFFFCFFFTNENISLLSSISNLRTRSFSICWEKQISYLFALGLTLISIKCNEQRIQFSILWNVWAANCNVICNFNQQMAVYPHAIYQHFRYDSVQSHNNRRYSSVF